MYRAAAVIINILFIGIFFALKLQILNSLTISTIILFELQFAYLLLIKFVLFVYSNHAPSDFPKQSLTRTTLLFSSQKSYGSLKDKHRQSL